MVSGTEFVKAKIAEYKVVVFSKTYSPYSTMAKKALDSTNVEYHVVEIENMNNDPPCDDVQNACHQLTGQTDVPYVFVGGKFIGGGTETKALQESENLVPLLQEAGAL